MMEKPKFTKFGIEFNMSITSFIIAILILIIGTIFIIYKYKCKSRRQSRSRQLTEIRTDEDVIQLGHVGVI
ncbi:hypothetical protein TSAR_006984 [Trichomalopsis sarcophagae]|uniref:Uncharacterized protein n=1 Tax=Trichomalopsis sarcophagae TaxID=543379 RepID=A0A232EYB8_9HYME|nr:hypothetical protein TSAR_006984 [Trichomalopsis sarcophagae]